MKKSKKSAEVRKRILDASEELFALKGYDATGIAQIAEKAGITKSLLYYYFESKENILEELFSDCLSATIEEKKKIFSSGLNQAQTISRSMSEGFSLLSGNKRIIRVLIAEMLKGNVKNESLCMIESMIPASISNPDYKTKDEGATDMATYAFFFGLTPVIAYMLFGETWIKNNGMDKTAFTNQFVDMAAASFSNDITGVSSDFFEPLKSALAENLQKLLED